MAADLTAAKPASLQAKQSSVRLTRAMNRYRPGLGTVQDATALLVGRRVCSHAPQGIGELQHQNNQGEARTTMLAVEREAVAMMMTTLEAMHALGVIFKVL